MVNGHSSEEELELWKVFLIFGNVYYKSFYLWHGELSQCGLVDSKC